MTARPSKLRLSAPIAASDPVIIGLAGTMLHPDTVFSLLPGDPRAPLVTVDWIAASDKTGLRSVCAALANELTAARAGPIIVIGHSSGGAIALMLALNHPELVSGLLLTNTGANTHGHGDPDAPKRLAAGLTPDIVHRFIDRCFSIAPAPGAAEALRNYALACPDECVVAAMTSQRSIDLAPRLPEIACPVAIVHGIRDPVRTRMHIDVLLGGMAGSTLTSANCGHTPPMECPAVFAEALGGLLDRVLPAQVPGV